jgi:hypothetical protein
MKAESDSQPAATATGEPASGRDKLVKPADNWLRLFEEQFSCARQLGSMLPPLKERATQVFFDPPNLLGKGRLA